MENFIITVRGKKFRGFFPHTLRFAERVAYRKGFRHAIEMILDGKTEGERHWED